jgi:hypothetical protein
MFSMKYTDFILALVGIVALAVVLRGAVILRLKTRHSELWRELGAPSPLDVGLGHEAPRRATGYLWKAKWLHSQDPILVALGIANFAVAAGTVVLFYIQFVSGY